MLAGGRESSSAIEGSYQHIVTDLVAFAAAGLAAIVILITGFDRADAIASIFVALLMVRAGVSLVRASWRVFLESAPEGVDPGEIGRAIAALPGVVEVHDLHVWEIANGYAALSAHVLVEPARTAPRLRARWKRFCTSASRSATRRCRSASRETSSFSCRRARAGAGLTGAASCGRIRTSLTLTPGGWLIA